MTDDQGNAHRDTRKPAGPRRLRLLGGRLPLDFANTVDPRHGEGAHDFIAGYADLLTWGEHAGAITAGQSQRLLRQAKPRPAEARAALDAALALREALYALFSSAAAGLPPPLDALQTLNVALARALAQSRLTPLGNGCAWSWNEDPAALDRPLWPIARAAADLLTAPELARVRECPAEDGCGWLFLDTSKNGSRRWCSMEGCGNRAKARRHYARGRDR